MASSPSSLRRQLDVMLFLEHTHAVGGDGGGGDALDGSAAPQPPSLFELLMQERMGSGFKPAAEYMLQTVCDAYPQVSRLWIAQCFEESYALLKYALDKYFLERYDSLASEKFYGMKRVMYHAPEAAAAATSGGSTPQPTTTPLTADARRQALVYAVLVPYLKAKMDNFYKDLVDEQPLPPTATNEQQQASAETTSNTTLVARSSLLWRRFWLRMRQFALLKSLKKGFVNGYPFVHFAYEASFFVYQWLYLFGDTPYFSPFLRRMKMILVRITANDESAFQQQQATYRKQVLAAIAGNSLLSKCRRGALRLSWATFDHSYVLLVLGIAGYKFVEWMYSEEGVAAKVRMTGSDAPTPPPPLPPQFSGQAMALGSMDPSMCPLCRKHRVNPAMSVSGFVFCYLCLYRHVEAHGECPVTQMKCDLASITKIYDDNAKESS
ncbi:TPA: hypothetical protein N0F65_000607 [Lagenidium giganteum]|uniref:Peroxin-12 n=1 Tax=Lagenidium giganteum TaxID=4803 RepID=A0AAV2YLY8_9STRA|nr:TPA: hypothetical protein N0F65_000607 [Lagenidium giganteum]